MTLGAVRPFLLAAGALVALAGVSPALAQGRVDARYQVTLGGLPIGKGAWVIDIAEDQYTAAASGATSGMLRVFASGQGSGASRGYMINGMPIAASFAGSITADKKTEEIRMSLDKGDIKDFVITPPTQPNPDRIPLTDAHRKGAIDPMSAMLLRVSGNGNPVSAQACQRVLPVFDGRVRYDLALVFKRIEQVRPTRATKARWWCAASISRRSPAMCRTALDQVSRQAARHGDLVCAGRRHPCGGAVRVIIPTRSASA